MLLAPYSSEDQRQFLASSLDLLKCSSSSKYEVAASLHVHPTSTETATPTAEKDPLLSQCFGNKSAVLYEMNKYKVRENQRLWRIIIFYYFAGMSI